MAGPNLQAFFDELMIPRSRLGRAPGLGTGQAAAGPGVQPTAPAEGLRALMGNLRTGPFPGSTPRREANVQRQTDRLNANAPGRLFAGLFNQEPFQPTRSGFQWQPPTGSGLSGESFGVDGQQQDPQNPQQRPLTRDERFRKFERGG